jgi:preprotein translocase subunit SecG
MRSKSFGVWIAWGGQTEVCPPAIFRGVHAFLSALQVFISIILIALILMHSGKDAGLSGAFGVGGGSQLGSGSLVERNLNRWTVLFGILFIANIILLLKV